MPIAEHAHRRLLRDGRRGRTVTVKMKKADMSTLTRSATLPYATAEPATLAATAHRLLLDPATSGRYAFWAWAFPDSATFARSRCSGSRPVRDRVLRKRIGRRAARACSHRLAGRRRRAPSAVRARLECRAPDTAWSVCASKPEAVERV